MGFLHDILLFTIIDETYIARDIKCTEDNIQEIFNGKDLSEGIFLLINDRQNDEKIIKTVQEALGFCNSQNLNRLWCSNIYYIY